MRNKLTGVSDDDVDVARDFLDERRGSLAVLLACRHKFENVDLSGILLYEFLQVCSCSRVARTGEYDHVIAEDKCLDQSETWA